MKSLIAILLIAFAGAAAADTYGPFTVAPARPVNGLVADVCVALRAELGNPTPWDEDVICARHLWIRAVRRHHLVYEERAAEIDRRARVDAARTAGDD